MTTPSSPHRFLNPAGLLPARGFSHVAVPAAGQVVHLAGQTAHTPDGALRGSDVVAQTDAALANVVTALAAAGAAPGHVVAMQLFVTDVPAWRAALPDLGQVWRRHLGSHYPALSLLGVSALFDPDALVEITAVAVIPT